MEGMLIGIVVGVSFLCLAVPLVIVLVMHRRSSKSYMFRVNSHEVLLRIQAYGGTLSVDGETVDELFANGLVRYTLRTQLAGEELRVHVCRRTPTRLEVTAFYGKTPLTGTILSR